MRASFLTVAAVAILVAYSTLSASAKQPTPPPGGSHQRSATEGCVNQWLFNGIWRMRVTRVRQIAPPDASSGSAWGINVETRNGTSQDDSPVWTGLGTMTIAFADGNTMDQSASTTGTLNGQKLKYHDFPPSARFTHELLFFYPYNTKPEDIKKPVKLIVPFDANVRKGHPDKPQFTTPNPSFRFHLDCSK